ncbi:MAG: Mu transposase C-terminal domain-containing protein [Proteobacteria bacterium]|nr:Mu transposase C-terminal domain-containing protein [Pseudomonadota bacterium]
MTQWIDLTTVARALRVSPRAIQLRARRENWVTGQPWPVDATGTWRRREGRGGGVLISTAVLPPEARLHLEGAAPAGDGQAAASPPKAGDQVAAAPAPAGEMWRRYEALPDSRKAEAEKRAALLRDVERLADGGLPRNAAFAMVASQAGIADRTLRLWRARVGDAPTHDWPACLVSHYVGAKGRELELEPEAWDLIRSDWLRLEQPTFESCWRRLELVADEKGWQLPSKKTVERRLLALPLSVRTAGRQGMEALKRLYPAQKRDRSMFHALQAVNVDGHKWDVMVKWSDGTIGRPMMVAFQDLYSGKMLSWRIDRTENAETVRLAIGDLVSTFGVPDLCWLDNGRGFASKWITGGSPTRYRFKVKDEDPAGLLTTLGVEIHWTTPYSGQSKPIERAFRDFCSDIAKDPRFAGAWTGNNPMAKPENYGSKAVPIDTFMAVVAEGIAAHNARPGRRTDVAQGQSFDEVFLASYQAAPIRRVTAEQRRLWLLAAEGLRARRDGSIELLGNRYWTEALVDHAQQKLTVRFDPQALQTEVHVYRLDGSYICAAPVIEAAGFADVQKAREHAAARGQYLKATREQLAAEKVLTTEQVAKLLPKVEAPEPPEPTVVRPVFGNLALVPRQDVEAIEDDEEDRGMLNVGKFLTLVRPPNENGADG